MELLMSSGFDISAHMILNIWIEHNFYFNHRSMWTCKPRFCYSHEYMKHCILLTYLHFTTLKWESGLVPGHKTWHKILLIRFNFFEICFWTRFFFFSSAFFAPNAIWNSFSRILWILLYEILVTSAACFDSHSMICRYNLFNLFLRYPWGMTGVLQNVFLPSIFSQLKLDPKFNLAQRVTVNMKRRVPQCFCQGPLCMFLGGIFLSG